MQQANDIYRHIMLQRFIRSSRLGQQVRGDNRQFAICTHADTANHHPSNRKGHCFTGTEGKTTRRIGHPRVGRCAVVDAGNGTVEKDTMAEV